MKHIHSKLRLVLEGTLTEGSQSELDLKHEKWCACSNPTGFHFVKSEGGEQIWRHVTCGGLVIRPMHNASAYKGGFN